MNNKSRKLNSIINSSVGLVSQMISLVAQFALQTLFVKTLGAEYLGLNGLFSNVLQFLALAELGIGGAITFSLFGPIARKETDVIQAIMGLYKKIYRVIALSIATFGIAFSFFVPYFIKQTDIKYVQVLFLLYLINSVVSYFFSYRRTLLVADQRAAIDAANQTVFKVIQVVLQGVILIYTHSYALYLIIQILVTISSNLSIFVKTNKLYPFLSDVSNLKLDSEIITTMKKNVIGAFSAKIGSAVMFGTDNILLAKFVGLSTVGIYSNYMLILTALSALIGQLLNPLSSSIANYINDETAGGADRVFFRYMYIVNFVVLTLGGSLSVSISMFVSIWVGRSYVMAPIVLSLIIFNWMINTMRTTVLSFMTAVGTYWETRWKSLVESLVNLLVGVILIVYTDLGVIAVVIGTLSANLLLNSWFEPLVLFRKQRDINSNKYVYRYIVSLAMAALFAGIPNVLGFKSGTFMDFLITGGSAVVILATVYLLVTYRCEEAQYFRRLVADFVLNMHTKKR